MTSNKITDEELKEMLLSYDKIDTDLDNMIIDEEITFSDEHNKKMKQYFEKLRAEENSKARIIKFKNYKIVASVVLAIIVSTAIFNVDTISVYANKIKEFVISEFEKFSIASVNDETNEQNEYSLDEFELDYDNNLFKTVETELLPDYKIYKYSSGNGKYIKLIISKETSQEIIDTENADLTKKVIKGITYNVIAKDDIIKVYFIKDGFLYNIKTNMSENEIFKEIEKMN